jgi:hypothetical protein
MQTSVGLVAVTRTVPSCPMSYRHISVDKGPDRTRAGDAVLDPQLFQARSARRGMRWSRSFGTTTPRTQRAGWPIVLVDPSSGGRQIEWTCTLKWTCTVLIASTGDGGAVAGGHVSRRGRRPAGPAGQPLYADLTGLPPIYI